MIAKRLPKHQRINQQISDEERTTPSPLSHQTLSPDLTMLNNQLGNQVMQHVLPTSPAVVQREADPNETTQSTNEADLLEATSNEEANETDPEKPFEVGTISIDKLEIEQYTIEANSYEEALQQVQDKDDWCQYEFEHDTSVEEELINEVNITITITLQLPQWIGTGWEQAPPMEQQQWLMLLTSYGITDDTIDEMMKLPQQWLLGPAWEDAPTPLKKNWQTMLQDFQKDELGYFDIAYRRAMVLQQRLFKQPETEIPTIFGQFLKDIELEQEAYDDEYEPGEAQDITLNSDALVQ